MVPSAFAAMRAREYVPEVGPEASITSVRVMLTLTGRRSFCESSAATGSR